MKKFIMLFIVLIMGIGNISNVLASDNIETIVQSKEYREVAWLSSMLINRNYVEQIKSGDEVKVEKSNDIGYEDKHNQCNKKYPWTIYRAQDDKCICPNDDTQWNPISKLCTTKIVIKADLNNQLLKLKKEKELKQNNICEKKLWTVYEKSENKCVCMNYYYEEWSDINNKCENIFNYVPNLKEQKTLKKYINIVDKLHLKSPDKIEQLNNKIENILFNLESWTKVHFIFSVLQNQIKLLNTESWSKNDWTGIDLNCDKADIKIWDQVWAWCNSTLWEWEEYNSEHCFDYNGNQITWCNTLSNTKENDYDSINWVDNIWGKFYDKNNMFSACVSWYHVPTKDEWNVLEMNLSWLDVRNQYPWLWWKWHFSKNKTNNLVNALDIPLSWFNNWNRGNWVIFLTNSVDNNWHNYSIEIKSNKTFVDTARLTNQKASVRCIKDSNYWKICNIRNWKWKQLYDWTCEVTSCSPWYFNNDNKCTDKCSIKNGKWKQLQGWVCEVISCDPWYYNLNNKSCISNICSITSSGIKIWEWKRIKTEKLFNWKVITMDDCNMTKCFNWYSLENGKCIMTSLSLCQGEYWLNSVSTSTKDANWNYTCKCKSWFKWGYDRKSCIKSTSTNTSTNTSTSTSTSANTIINTYLEIYDSQIKSAKRSLESEKDLYKARVTQAHLYANNSSICHGCKYPQSTKDKLYWIALYEKMPNKFWIYDAKLKLILAEFDKELFLVNNKFLNQSYIEEKLAVLEEWYWNIKKFFEDTIKEVNKDWKIISKYNNDKWLIYNDYASQLLDLMFEYGREKLDKTLQVKLEWINQ